MSKRIAIIGNGVYGTALAYLLGKKHTISLFGRTPKDEHEKCIDDFGMDGEAYDYLIMSITTKPLSSVFTQIYQKIHPDMHILLAMKGLTEEGTLPLDACRRMLPQGRISILSGPGFAEEILSDIPVHLVLASEYLYTEEKEDFLIENLTIDYTTDIYGVSWCGVLKNIYAIGAGIISREGDFDRVRYTQDAVEEMSFILASLGFDPKTAHGPAGRGDIWICTTPSSRNFRFGAGDAGLRDQAEGYNALLQCKEIFREILENSELPLLRKVCTEWH